MGKINCGPATASFEIGNDGLVRARLSGLVVQSNAGAISAMLLQAAAAAKASGVLSVAADSVVALPPVTSTHYAYVPEDLRSVPVAIVMSAEQAGVYENVATEAALSGTMRCAFLSPAQSEAWLQQRVRALAANQLWWSARRSPP